MSEEWPELPDDHRVKTFDELHALRGQKVWCVHHTPKLAGNLSGLHFEGTSNVQLVEWMVGPVVVRDTRMDIDTDYMGPGVWSLYKPGQTIDKGHDYYVADHLYWNDRDVSALTFLCANEFNVIPFVGYRFTELNAIMTDKSAAERFAVMLKMGFAECGDDAFSPTGQFAREKFLHLINSPSSSAAA